MHENKEGKEQKTKKSMKDLKGERGKMKASRHFYRRTVGKKEMKRRK